MNLKSTTWKIVVSDIIAVILTSITMIIFFPFPVQEQAVQAEPIEGVLRSVMFHIPEPVVLLYLLVLLVLYYSVLYILWSLFEKSKTNKGGIKKVRKK